MKHDLRLPDQMTEENIAKVRRILAGETYLTEMTQSAGLSRDDLPGLVAAVREDEHVLLLASGGPRLGATPTNLLDIDEQGDGLTEYRFMPTRDEYRG